MTPTDSSYYRGRADEERVAAADAIDDRAAEAHLEMARQYDEIADRYDGAQAA
jgi:hypothetical protein